MTQTEFYRTFSSVGGSPLLFGRSSGAWELEVDPGKGIGSGDVSYRCGGGLALSRKVWGTRLG